MSESRLGKGLDDLLPEPVDDVDAELRQVPTDEIIPNPDQPRDHFDEDRLQELTQSIEEQGVVEPILVRPHRSQDHRFMIVAGERRWRAACQAGLERIPAVIRDLETDEAYILSMVENVQREDLSPLEEARAYQQLMNSQSLSQTEAAELVGKSRSAVANRLRLLNLSDTIKKALRENKITEGHARSLLAVESSDDHEHYLNKIIKNNLSVRETEELIRNANMDTTTESNDDSGSDQENRPTRFDRLEAKMEDSIGAPVHIDSTDKKSGRIVINFGSPDEFEQLMSRIISIKKDSNS